MTWMADDFDESTLSHMIKPVLMPRVFLSKTVLTPHGSRMMDLSLYQKLSIRGWGYSGSGFSEGEEVRGAGFMETYTVISECRNHENYLSNFV